MAEKQTNKDRMREIVDSIENGIKELFESDKYQQYLSTMSRFHRYNKVCKLLHHALSSFLFCRSNSASFFSAFARSMSRSARRNCR